MSGFLLFLFFLSFFLRAFSTLSFAIRSRELSCLNPHDHHPAALTLHQSRSLISMLQRPISGQTRSNLRFMMVG